MPISVRCPQCSATLPVPDELAGRSIRCGGCQGIVTVPTAPTPVAPATPPAPAAPTAPPARPVARAVPVKAPPADQKPKPIVRKAPTDDDDETPKPRKAVARRADEDNDATEESSETARTPRRRPIAKRRPTSILSGGAMLWLSLLLCAGGLGIMLFAYSVLGTSKKSDTKADQAANVNPQPLVAQAPPVAKAPNPARVNPPEPPKALEPRQPAIEEMELDIPPGAEFVPQQNFGVGAMPNRGQFAPVPPAPKLNPNDLIARHRGQLRVEACSEWNGWPASFLVDGNSTNAWFPTQVPPTGAWVKITFPEAVMVSRVHVLGNHDPNWPMYLVSSGVIELLDEHDNILMKHSVRGELNQIRDFDWKLKAPLANVRAVRFNAILDGSGRATSQVALSEIQVE